MTKYSPNGLVIKISESEKEWEEEKERKRKRLEQCTKEKSLRSSSSMIFLRNEERKKRNGDNGPVVHENRYFRRRGDYDRTRFDDPSGRGNFIFSRPATFFLPLPSRFLLDHRRYPFIRSSLVLSFSLHPCFPFAFFSFARTNVRRLPFAFALQTTNSTRKCQ